MIYLWFIVALVVTFFIGVWLAPVIRNDYGALKAAAKNKAVNVINKI